MSQESQSFNEMPLSKKFEIIKILAAFPAISVMVFFRRKVGYRTLMPQWLAILGIVMFVVAFAAPEHYNKQGWALALYALLMVIWGLIQRQLRWRDICKGVRWSTRTSGISFLEYLPLPEFFHRQRRIYRSLDPLLVLIVSLVAGYTLSQILGLWLLLGAISLFIYENTIYEMMIERDLDILDGLIAAEVQSETAQFFQNPGNANQERVLKDTAGIPTGLAPDLTHQIEKRKARKPKAPDNLA